MQPLIRLTFLLAHSLVPVTGFPFLFLHVSPQNLPFTGNLSPFTGFIYFFHQRYLTFVSLFSQSNCENRKETGNAEFFS